MFFNDPNRRTSSNESVAISLLDYFLQTMPAITESCNYNTLYNKASIIYISVHVEVIWKSAAFNISQVERDIFWRAAQIVFIRVGIFNSEIHLIWS